MLAKQLKLMAMIAGVALAGAIALSDRPTWGQSTPATSLEDLTRLLAREEPPLGSRGMLCPISPGVLGETDVIWSDRPTFIWRGKAERLTVRQLANRETVWSEALPDTAQQIVYTGPPLQPGQVYEWELQSATNQGRKSIFEVMPFGERDRVSQALQSLEARFKTSNTESETVAVELAHYFAEQGLWSDALQTLQSVTTPSPLLTHHLQSMTAYLCGEASLPTVR